MKKSVFFIVLSFLSNSVFSQILWDGTITPITPIDNVYEVRSASDLAWLAEQSKIHDFEGETISLESDIDLNNRLWTPIGSKTFPFNGFFNGNNHVFRNINKIKSIDGIGLFGYIGEKGCVSNLVISSGILANDGIGEKIGSIAGENQGIISHCFNMSQIALAGNLVGGIVGVNKGTVEYCYNTGILLTANDTVGGLVGKNIKNAKIHSCYNIGYCQTGNTIVGFNEGEIKNVYHDRRMYLRNSGDTLLVTDVDKTEDMFLIFKDDPENWITIDGLYPQLKSFASSDASLVSVAPLFVDTMYEFPFNHADDLTRPFKGSSLNGVEWDCLSSKYEELISISENEGEVYRPCESKYAIITATLNDEIKQVYVAPRKWEDFDPGKYGVTWRTCQNSVFNIKRLGNIPPLGGNGQYVYTLKRYDQDTTLIEEFKDMTQIDYDNFLCDTSEPGTYLYERFVHDTKCCEEYKRTREYFTLIVTDIFNPGEIDCEVDTIYGVPSEKEVVKNILKAYNGYGQINYRWFYDYSLKDYVSNKTISQKKHVCAKEDGKVAVLDSLSFIFEEAGEYLFCRYAWDELCVGDSIFAEPTPCKKLFRVFSVLDAGTIGENAMDELVFCSVDEAQSYIIEEKKHPKGGNGRYQYRWGYSDNGSAVQYIIGDSTVSLSDFALEQGHTYIFQREVKDDTGLMNWTLSENKVKVTIYNEFDPGEIKTDTIVLDGFDTGTWIVDNVKEASGGDNDISYLWFYSYKKKTNDLDYNPKIRVPIDSACLEFNFTKTGEYLFSRYAFDGYCVKNSLNAVKSTGNVLFVVYDEFDAGSINKKDTLFYCDEQDALTVNIGEQIAPSGGDGRYHYRWIYTDNNGDDIIYKGAEEKNLSLSEFSFKKGHSYAFHREVRDESKISLPDISLDTIWRSSSDTLVISIYSEFNPGEINSDDIKMNGIPSSTFSIQSKIDAVGGNSKNIKYAWYYDLYDITGDKKIESDVIVVDNEGEPITTASCFFRFSSIGKYVFKRYAFDEICVSATDAMKSVGTKTFYIYEEFSPGSVEPQSIPYCYINDAQKHTILEQNAASGGSGNYEYRWLYYDENNQEHLFEVSQKSLSLSSFPFAQGVSYRFYREVRDSLAHVDWFRSDNDVEIRIHSEFTSGTIVSGDKLECNHSQELYTVLISNDYSASGDGAIVYRWVLGLMDDATNEVSIQEIIPQDSENLNYTFNPMNYSSFPAKFVLYRETRNETCDTEWIKSNGEYVLRFDNAVNIDSVLYVCSDDLPYTINYERENGILDSYMFSTDGEEVQFSNQTIYGCERTIKLKCILKEKPEVDVESLGFICQEDSTLSIYYTIKKGTPTHYRVTFNEAMSLYGVSTREGVLDESSIIVLTGMPNFGIGDFEIYVQFYDGTWESCWSDVYTLSATFALGGYIHQKWDHVLFVDNNEYNNLPDSVSDMHFSSFQWYKNGRKIEGANKQFYNEPSGLKGTYYVMLVDDKGRTYRSCDVIITPEKEIDSVDDFYVAPSLVAKEGKIEVYTSRSGMLNLYNSMGNVMTTVRCSEGSSQFSAPLMSGMYIYVFTDDFGKRSVSKILVK